MFQSKSGRFLSQDPIRADESNLYRYAGNNPVNDNDPRGLESAGQRAERQSRLIQVLLPRLRAMIARGETLTARERQLFEALRAAEEYLAGNDALRAREELRRTRMVPPRRRGNVTTTRTDDEWYLAFRRAGVSHGRALYYVRAMAAYRAKRSGGKTCAAADWQPSPNTREAGDCLQKTVTHNDHPGELTEADLKGILLGDGHHWFPKAMVTGTKWRIPGFSESFKDAIWGYTTGDFEEGVRHDNTDHGKLRNAIREDFKEHFRKPNGDWDLDALGTLNEKDAEKYVKNIMDGKTPISGKDSKSIADFTRDHIEGKVESKLAVKTPAEARVRGKLLRRLRGFGGGAAKIIWWLDLYEECKDIHHLLRGGVDEEGRTFREKVEEMHRSLFISGPLPGPNPFYQPRPKPLEMIQ